MSLHGENELVNTRIRSSLLDNPELKPYMFFLKYDFSGIEKQHFYSSIHICRKLTALTIKSI